MGADSTDNLDISSARPGPDFPSGVVVAMNGKGRNFMFASWLDVVQRAPGTSAVALQVTPSKR